MRGRGESGAARPTLRTYLVVLAASLAFALFLRAVLVHAYHVPSASMEDTLLVGDYFLAERVTFGATVEIPWLARPILRLPPLRPPRRGDLVIFRSWADPAQEFVKRCVAVAGDTVELIDDTLFVNGVPFDSVLARRFRADDPAFPRIKYLARDAPVAGGWRAAERLRDYGPHIVGPGRIFVMGDNRDNSDDSRRRGDVPLSAVRGRPMLIYWSVEPGSGSRNPFSRVRWRRIGRVLR